ncbi:MAG TPA: hypothetical protein DDW54_03145, partial [Clostridiales bacterium]|nr:hypothetical protein [Clostridiales bacterium]
LTVSLFIAVAVLAVFAILANLIKDGTQTWVPTILKETYGLPDSLSILLTLLLPVLGIFGALLAVAINRFVKDFVLLSSVLFAATAAFTALIIIFLGLPYWALVTLCFGVISLLMHSVNNVITSIAPLYLRDKINTGLLAGLLNGFCYVGSTVSSYGLGALSSGDSWNAVFDLFLYCTLGAVVIGVGYFVFTKVKNGKNR